VIHRDIKPENILLHDGHAIISDFGVARAITAAGDGTLTQSGVAVGTAAYMSPEQAAGETELDGRTDVYSLGCLLYEMLAGEPPFTGPTAQVVISRRFVEDPPSVRRLRQSVPEAVERAIMVALAREPADRFASAARFSESITDTQAGPTISSGLSSDREQVEPSDQPLLLSRVHHILERRDHAQFETAKALLEQALVLNARSAEAHALLGVLHVLRADLDLDLEGGTDGALRAARHALEIEPAHATGHAVLGLALTLRWEWRDAERAFRRALDPVSTSPFARHWFAIYATARGRLGEAQEALTRALQQRETTPLRFALSTVMYYERAFDVAIAKLRALVRDDPSNAGARVLLGLALAGIGSWKEAIQEYERSVDIANEAQPFTVTSLGCTLAAAGRRTDAERVHAQLESLACGADVSPFYRAAMCAALGDTSNALVALRKAYEQRDSWLLALKVHPWMDALRREDSFKEIVSDIGL
jgi:tetratricopeptide (TPR) repeat protein